MIKQLGELIFLALVIGLCIMVERGIRWSYILFFT